ncbi:MAG: hypothetical protein A3H94_03890 [Acidobacteria bacterium RIFCSPLOWO2_02_FULL_60_20]|nr:MAG: hypothetical protein A3H94_03890 [Acidobacteria bacterium RIFCSPLOWO2_02_FULL_60_20]
MDVVEGNGVREFLNGNFMSHITLGFGTAPAPDEPFEFLAGRIGLFHLGHFCSCRLVLEEWRLGSETQLR